jgi:AcrR family transcriptional regulator
VIRDTAMALFGERGAADVSVREIATAAGVSPGLVIHHFGSKAGLKAAVDKRAGEILGDLLNELVGPDAPASGSLSDAFASALERDPALLGYIRRNLVDGGPAGAELFRRLFEVTEAGLGGLAELGVIRPAADAPIRAAVVLANDLAVILLRDAIASVLGFDPLAREGLARWGAELLDLYTRGLFAGGDPAGADFGGSLTGTDLGREGPRR